MPIVDGGYGSVDVVDSVVVRGMVVVVVVVVVDDDERSDESSFDVVVVVVVVEVVVVVVAAAMNFEADLGSNSCRHHYHDDLQVAGFDSGFGKSTSYC